MDLSWKLLCILKSLAERFLPILLVWDVMEAMSGQIPKIPADLQCRTLSNSGTGSSCHYRFRCLTIHAIHHLSWLLLLIGGLIGCGQNRSEDTPSVNGTEIETLAKLASLSALNLEGNQVRPFSSLSQGITRGAVVLFVATDCPISNRYAPKVKRIYNRFKDDAIPFYLVYTRPDESFEEIQKHLNDFEYPMTALIDKQRQLTEYTGAQVTPEAVVFDAKGEMIYRGRIDDRFEDFGLSRQESTTHELEDVMALIADGKTQDFHEEIAVGCYIVELFEEAGDE